RQMMRRVLMVLLTVRAHRVPEVPLVELRAGADPPPLLNPRVMVPTLRQTSGGRISGRLLLLLQSLDLLVQVGPVDAVLLRRLRLRPPLQPDLLHRLLIAALRRPVPGLGNLRFGHHTPPPAPDRNSRLTPPTGPD